MHGGLSGLGLSGYAAIKNISAQQKLPFAEEGGGVMISFMF